MIFYQFFDFLIFENEFLHYKIRWKQNQSGDNSAFQTAVGTDHRILNGITYQKQKNDIARIKLWQLIFTENTHGNHHKKIYRQRANNNVKNWIQSMKKFIN